MTHNILRKVRPCPELYIIPTLSRLTYFSEDYILLLFIDVYCQLVQLKVKATFTICCLNEANTYIHLAEMLKTASKVSHYLTVKPVLLKPNIN